MCECKRICGSEPTRAGKVYEKPCSDYYNNMCECVGPLYISLCVLASICSPKYKKKKKAESKKAALPVFIGLFV